MSRICHDDLEAENDVLMNVTKHPMSVFQIHLDRFVHYPRRQWILMTVKTVTLKVADGIKEKNQPTFSTAVPSQWLCVGPAVHNI